jgi:hypothetical protein
MNLLHFLKNTSKPRRRPSSAYRDAILKDVAFLWWPAVLFFSVLPPLPVGDPDEAPTQREAPAKVSRPHRHHHQ